VSNTAGASSIDPSSTLAKTLSTNTGVHVLQHSTKKPGCGSEILAYLRAQEETKDIRPDQIAVVGDRLMTDMLLANMMGGYGVWVKDGVIEREKKSVVCYTLQGSG
jgi:phosphatidylglycerophosphatase GEP4